jgi:hypothetical protein
LSVQPHAPAPAMSMIGGRRLTRRILDLQRLGAWVESTTHMLPQTSPSKRGQRGSPPRFARPLGGHQAARDGIARKSIQVHCRTRALALGIRGSRHYAGLHEA